eukprot:TRINITY_DN5420_c0_g1_i5.p1 TRINITY_DN5420_c0_g1~~TRINITY_DN5420_c0_g1_i5.p1  ORF type:complete len:502 (+),score=36.50 TRINITY_DN5420_c0_g1_i5:155-1507(+)
MVDPSEWASIVTTEPDVVATDSKETISVAHKSSHAMCPSGECRKNSDCPTMLICYKSKCRDPCRFYRRHCGEYALCRVVKSEPTCICPRGFKGNPYRRCKPIKGFRRGKVHLSKRNQLVNSDYAVQPRCRSSYTLVGVFVTKSGGEALKGALVHDYTRVVKTNKDGVAKLKVTGCQISLIVTAEGMQPEHIIHSLHDCLTFKKSLAVHLSPKCNFQLFLYNGNNQLFKYTFSASDGSTVENEKQVGHGTAVASMRSPLCLYWPTVESGDMGRFTFIGRTPSVSAPFVLNITSQDNSAALSIPPSNEDYDFLFCFNLWIKDEAGERLLNNGPDYFPFIIRNLCVIFEQTTFDNVCILIKLMECNFQYGIVLISSKSLQYRGSVTIVDKRGRYRTSEIPATPVSGLPRWRLLCNCNSTKNTDELLLFDDTEFKLSVSPTRCEQLCPDFLAGL